MSNTTSCYVALVVGKGEGALNRKAASMLIILIFTVSVPLSIFTGTLKTAKADNQSSDSNGDPNTWSMFRGDSAHTGCSSSTTAIANMTDWTFYVGGSSSVVGSSPVVDAGTVYCCSAGNIFALNASTGLVIWTYSAHFSGDPAIADGLVYAGGDSATFAFNSSTGSILWQSSVSCSSSPVACGGSVYTGSYDGDVYALNESTGYTLWASRVNTFSNSNIVVSTPAVAGNMVYVGGGDYRVYALDSSSGRVIWTFTTGNYVVSSPLVNGGVVYIGSYDDNMYALDALTGIEIWHYRTGDLVSSSPALANGVLYFGSRDSYVYALNSSSGSKIWSYKTGGPFVYSSPAVADGKVYIGLYHSSFCILNSSTGNMIESYPAGGVSSPAVVNGSAFMNSDDGNLYAFTSTGTLTTISFSNYPVVLDTPVTLLASVFGNNPAGTITWATNSTNGVFGSTSSTATSGTSLTTFVETNPGTDSITAFYAGDLNNSASSRTILLSFGTTNVSTSLSFVHPGTRNSSVVAFSGGKFNVDIRIDNSPGLWGWSFTVNWNPRILQLIEVTEGPLLKQVASTLFIVGVADNLAGTIDAGINDVLLSYDVANGTGVLVTLTFQAINPGFSSVDINYNALNPYSSIITNTESYMSLPNIPFTTNNAVVTVLTSQYSPIDFYYTGTVNFQDVIYFVTAYLAFHQNGTYDPACDLNHDGAIDFSDVKLFVSDYEAYWSSGGH
jgi:outer membrane protein assembly factor BamB